MDRVPSFFQPPLPQSEFQPPLLQPEIVNKDPLYKPPRIKQCRWLPEETTILQGILKHPPLKHPPMCSTTRTKLSGWDWPEITKIYNEKIKADPRKFSEREMKNIQDWYYSDKQKEKKQKEKKITENPIPEESLKEPAKRRKRSSANAQNPSTVTTSAPRSPPTDNPLSIDTFDAGRFDIDPPPVHAANLFARTINGPSSSAFQFPLDPPQEERDFNTSSFLASQSRLYQSEEDGSAPQSIFLDNPPDDDINPFYIGVPNRPEYLLMREIDDQISSTSRASSSSLSRFQLLSNPQGEFKPESEESLEAPAKRRKRSSANAQNLSTVTTSAPRSTSTDNPLSIDITPFPPRKKREPWNKKEVEIITQIFDNNPPRYPEKKNHKTSNFKWVEITEIYNEKIIEHNKSDSEKLQKRVKASIYDWYKSKILKVSKYIKREHLPEIEKAIKEACPTREFSAVETCNRLREQNIPYTNKQIETLFNWATESLKEESGLEDPTFEDVLAKILQYRGGKITKKPISEESLEEPPKRIKSSSANAQNLSTVATSAPQSTPFDTRPLYINSPVHTADLFTRTINNQTSPTSQTSLSSSSAFQLPLDPPQEEFEPGSEPESLALSDSDEQFLSFLGSPPHADHSFPAEVN